MNNTLPFLDTQSPPKKKGFALVIVLSLIALVTILVMAYLPRSESEYAISNASANSASSSILATTALEIIVNDLRQEIITSSTTPADQKSVGPSSRFSGNAKQVSTCRF